MKEESFLHFSVLCIEFFIIFATVGVKMQTSWRKKKNEFLLFDSRFFVSLSAKNHIQPDY